MYAFTVPEYEREEEGEDTAVGVGLLPVQHYHQQVHFNYRAFEQKMFSPPRIFSLCQHYCTVIGQPTGGRENFHGVENFDYRLQRNVGKVQVAAVWKKTYFTTCITIRYRKIPVLRLGTETTKSTGKCYSLYLNACILS